MNQIGGAHHSPHHSHHSPHHHHPRYPDSSLSKHHRERFEELQKCVNQSLSEMKQYEDAPQDLSQRFPPLALRYPGYPPPPPPPPSTEIKTEPGSPGPAVTVKTEPEDPGYGLPPLVYNDLGRSGYPLAPPPPPPPERSAEERDGGSSRTIIGSIRVIAGYA